MPNGFNINDSRVTDDNGFSSRLLIVQILTVLTFLILVFRLFYLQIIKHGYYETMAKNNKEQIIPIPAFRGEIVDRNGVKLAENVKRYVVYLVPANLPTDEFKREDLLQRLCRVFSLDIEFVKEALRKARFHRYDPVEVKEDIAFEKVVYLAENANSFPGVYTYNKARRNYPLGNTMGHILGYVGPISSDEYDKLREEGYRRDSIIGKEGVELFYNKELHGIDGYIKRIVDSRNRVKEESTPKSGEPVPGKQLVLSVDHRIQKIVEDLLEGQNGTVIVSRPATGEILAMASSPWYDPNIFIGGLAYDDYKRLLDDPGNPFWNKAIRGGYPASSTFKIAISLAALSEGKLTPNRRVYCGGGMLLENKFFKCLGVHRWQDLGSAIQNSCNTYFYTIGYEIGPKIIKKYAQMLGLGNKSEIDLPWENTGLLPSPDWKRSQVKEYWWDGDTLHYAIGQGYMKVTPIAIHDMLCAVINDGVIYRPHIVKQIRSSQTGEVLVDNDKKVLRRVDIDATYFKIVKQALRRVVRWGTAQYGAYSPNLMIAGKTGTAETVKGKKSHSWFICYGPYSTQPSEEIIAVTVLIEHGGGGGYAAAPIGTAILRSIFEGQNPLAVRDSIMDRWQSIRERQRALWTAEEILGE